MLITVFTNEAGNGMSALHSEATRLYGQAKVGEHGKRIGTVGDLLSVACISDLASNELEIALITRGLGRFKSEDLKYNVHLNNIHKRGAFRPVLLDSEAAVETYNEIDRMMSQAWALVKAPADGDVFPENINVMTMSVAQGDTVSPVTILAFTYVSTVGTVFDSTIRTPKPLAARFYHNREDV